MLRSKVTSKGQVTLPKELREALGIRAADEVTFELREGEAVIKPARRGFLSRFGSISLQERPEDWQKVRELVSKDIAQKITKDLQHG